MSGSQAAILALLVAAFAAGWFTRGGDGDSFERDELAEAVEAGRDALAAAIAAYREGWRGTGLAIDEARREQERLVRALGEAHPCARDYEHALGTLELLASSGGGPVRRALEGVLDDASARYDLGAAAIAALAPD